MSSSVSSSVLFGLLNSQRGLRTVLVKEVSGGHFIVSVTTGRGAQIWANPPAVTIDSGGSKEAIFGAYGADETAS